MVGNYSKQTLATFFNIFPTSLVKVTLQFNGLLADKELLNHPANKQAVFAHHMIFAVHCLGNKLNCSEPSLIVVAIFSATSSAPEKPNENSDI